MKLVVSDAAVAMDDGIEVFIYDGEQCVGFCASSREDTLHWLGRLHDGMVDSSEIAGSPALSELIAHGVAVPGDAARASMGGRAAGYALGTCTIELNGDECSLDQAEPLTLLLEAVAERRKERLAPCRRMCVRVVGREPLDRIDTLAILAARAEERAVALKLDPGGLQWVVVTPSAHHTELRHFMDRYGKGACVIEDRSAIGGQGGGPCVRGRLAEEVADLSSAGYSCEVEVLVAESVVAEKLLDWDRVNGGSGVSVKLPRWPDHHGEAVNQPESIAGWRKLIDEVLSFGRTVHHRWHCSDPWRRVMLEATISRSIRRDWRIDESMAYIDGTGTVARSRFHAALGIRSDLTALFPTLFSTTFPHGTATTSDCDSCPLRPICDGHWSPESDALSRSNQPAKATLIQNADCQLRTGLLCDFLVAARNGASRGEQRSPQLVRFEKGGSLTFVPG